MQEASVVDSWQLSLWCSSEWRNSLATVVWIPATSRMSFIPAAPRGLGEAYIKFWEGTSCRPQGRALLGEGDVEFGTEGEGENSCSPRSPGEDSCSPRSPCCLDEDSCSPRSPCSLGCSPRSLGEVDDRIIVGIDRFKGGVYHIKGCDAPTSSEQGQCIRQAANFDIQEDPSTRPC